MTEKNEKTDENNKGSADEKPAKKTLSLSGSKGTLSLKGSSGGSSARTSRGGRGAAASGVAVEVRRKRSSRADAKEKAAEKQKTLTSAERESRARALKKALAEGEKNRTTLPKRHTIETKKKERAEAKKKKEDAAETVSLSQREKELEELQKIEAQERQNAQEAQQKSVDRFAHSPNALSYRERLKKSQEEQARQPKKPSGSQGGGRRRGRLTVTQALNEDYERNRSMSLAAQRRAREKARMAAKGPQEPKQKVLREVVLPEAITVGELANRMSERSGDVVKKLMEMGIMATITQTIDADTAELIVDEFGHTVKRVTEGDVEMGLEGPDDNPKDLKPRPPVVTIMGHVDHGKTSLLDALRTTDVVAGEAGGITQHIGAYQVSLSSDDKITFLDTPGHAAFTEMRARGANVTDIVVIVVAADDSIMPQTIEAISHAKAAEVPIIIAINKIDLPDANPQKVKTELLQHEVIVEEMGGDVQCVEISAKQKTNLDKLEETIILQAEILEIKANPNREASGVVVEAKQEKGRGSVATVLIQNGTLNVGDIFVAGPEFGKVRALINDKGKRIKTAVPGQPVEVLGLNGTPGAGDAFNVVDDESKAREISNYRQRQIRKNQAVQAVQGRTTIEQLLAQKEEGEKTTLPVLIKADVHGSLEAIMGSLDKMVEENDSIAVQYLHTGVGGITESDITLARASGGMIIGFNVRANAQARELAQRENADIRYYNVIYNVIDDVKAMLSGMLSPVEREEYIGQALVKEVFNISKVGKIAGCIVKEGFVKRGAKVRLLRDDVVILDGGTLKTLKRFKDEVPEVKEGTECGMAFENYDDLKDGDIIECYEVIEEARTVT